MSIAHDLSIDSGLVPIPNSPVPVPLTGRPLHRIAETRRRQGLSLRSAARRLGTSMDQVRREENPSFDMPLSELYQWQQALEVPVGELLVDCDATLSSNVLNRARLLRVMKTVRSIQETTKCISIERLAAMLEQQLVELMPELKDVSAWPSVGQRRSHEELGRTAERVMSDTFFIDQID
jgi:transcriptional regulator with XRE-family HTH domain